MKKILNKKKGIVLWITGLSGSGKTSISKLILNKFAKKYGKTLIFQGDQLRKIFQFKDYSRQGRKKNGIIYSELLKEISDQGINVIISVIGMIESVRKKNRKNIENYLEIFVESDLKLIIKKTKKKHYKLKKNVVGINIKPELPKKPDIKIKNDLNNSLTNLSNLLLEEISKKVK